MTRKPKEFPSSESSGARQRVSARALSVWLAALAIYIVAITGRTSFGVAGVDALDRFHINASQLAVFTAVQVGTYALMQIPTGLLIDRIGAKKSMLAGALVMAAGQTILALTTSYPVAIGARVLIGAGDASAFLGALRLLPTWFPLRTTPLFTQLTAGLGQLGQFLSAVPLLALLHLSGWTAAFISLAGAGLVVTIVGLIVLSDAPAQQLAQSTQAEPTARQPIGATLATVLTHPVCWQGFFTHWSGLMHQCIFTLLWGVPLMTLGLGLSPTEISAVLITNTVLVIVAGPFMGVISARAGAARFGIIFAISVAMMAAWAALLIPTAAPSLSAIVIVNIVMGALAPMSNLGFDSIREYLPRPVLATATGMANMGGFIATMIAAQGVGWLLDYSASGRSYTWADFRFAWLAVVAVWIIGTVGLLSSQWALRRRGNRVQLRA